MNDSDAAGQNDAMRPEIASALAERIATVRELVALLAISPAAATQGDFQPTVDALAMLCERLGRLLAQAGMADCVRTLANLEPTLAQLPADDAFRDIDAALTYLSARVRDVTLPPAMTATPAATEAPVEAEPRADAAAEDSPIAIDEPAMTDSQITVDGSVVTEIPIVTGEPAIEDGPVAMDAPDETPHLLDAGETQDSGNDIGSEDDAPVHAGADTVVLDAVEVAAPDDEDTFDEAAYPTEAREAIRGFRGATLRQRAPGEVTPVPRSGARMISDEIPEPMRRAFLAEAVADLADLRTLIASFSNMPGSLDDLHAMALLGHKVKGTAATYMYPRVAEIMYCFEGLPRVLQAVSIARSAECRDILIRFADIIEAALAEASEHGDASETQVTAAEALLTEARILVATAGPPDASATTTDSATETSGAASSPTQSLSERPTIHLPTVHRGDDDSHLRIEPRQFDSLMHQADGLAMNRAMLTQTSDEIRRVQAEIEHALSRLVGLSSQLSDLNPLIQRSTDTPQHGASATPWLTPYTSRNAWSDLELDSFTSFDDALRALSEAVLDASTLSGSLQGQIQRLTRNSDAQSAVLHHMQQSIIHLRLVSLKTLADRVTLAAYQVAQAEGKQVEVSISGEDTEIDRNISEALIAPIVQLVRNAVTHGIGSPSEREARHKPATGKIWMRASNSGGEVLIEVGDDGRGVNPVQLIAAAVAVRIQDAKTAEFLSREQALALMFAPNLSTKEQASIISGHGIGLDSVLADIQRLRGSISVRSEQGQGTVFQIRVPISLSITRALYVRAGDNEYAIPFSAVRQMFTVPEAAILVSLSESSGEAGASATRFPRRVRIAHATSQRPLRPPDDPSAVLYDEAPVFSLAELLGMEERPSANHLALLMDVGQRQVAVLVDEVVNESEVVIRALPPHLRRKAVRGASIAPDGRLFLVLDLADLLTDALSGRTTPRPQPEPEPAPEPPGTHAPRALIVDDSISIRRALQSTLAIAGFDVRLARDGVEALGVMLAELPDVMILDIEMPRLDGFELLSVLQGNEALARVPVVILTSRAAEKHHRRAMELGARAYLTKPCPDDVLITTLQRVLREPQQPS